MDDEDLAELQESRQLVDENDEMEFGTEAELRRKTGADAEEECVNPWLVVRAFANGSI